MKSLLFPFALLAIMFTGCVSYDYDGEILDPLPAKSPVQVQVTLEKVDPSAKKLGELRFTSPAGASAAEIRDLLRKAARKRGADIVLILSQERIKAGEVREDQRRNSAAPGWEKEDNSATATSIMENSILYSSGKDPDQTLYKTAVTAELYRK